MWQNVKILHFGRCLICTFFRVEKVFFSSSKKLSTFCKRSSTFLLSPLSRSIKFIGEESHRLGNKVNQMPSDFQSQTNFWCIDLTFSIDDLESNWRTEPAGAAQVIDVIITNLSQFRFSETRHPPSRRWYYDCLTLGCLYSKSLLHGLKMKPQKFSTRNTDEFNINTNSPSKPSSVALFHSSS